MSDKCEVLECGDHEIKTFTLAEGTKVYLCGGHLAEWEARRARVSRMGGPTDDLRNYEIWLTDEVKRGQPLSAKPPRAARR